MICQTGAFRRALSIYFQKKKKKKKSPTPFVSTKKKRKEKKGKLTKPRFSKVMHLFSKLEAFIYALSSFFGTSKNQSSLPKKKKKGENPFKK